MQMNGQIHAPATSLPNPLDTFWLGPRAGPDGVEQVTALVPTGIRKVHFQSTNCTGGSSNKGAVLQTLTVVHPVKKLTAFYCNSSFTSVLRACQFSVS